MATKEMDIMKQFEDSQDFAKYFTLKSNILIRKEDDYFSFDCAIYRDTQIYAVIELKHSIRFNESFSCTQKQIKRAIGVLNCNYGIITDGKEYYVITNEEAISDKYYSLNELIDLLTHSLPQDHFKNDVSAETQKLLTKYGKTEFIKRVTRNSSKYIFSEKDEYDFILGLIHKNESAPLYYYRYMSFDSAFKTLHDETYRMNSIVGMNDKSEVNYFDKKVFKNLNDNRNIANDIFISSFSSLKDDLTMWRLYGDDGRGVCLAFELKSNPQMFKHSKVCYGKKPLSLLRQIVELGWAFRNAEEWKHFFKAKEYVVEKEYRLLFKKTAENKELIKKEDWYVRNDTGIVSTYVTFDLNAKEFPLTLCKVIVGPKCTEQELNMEQLRTLTKRFKNDVIVIPSEIKTYR